MKIKLRSSILWEGQHHDSGSILEVSSTAAYNLISRGRAVKFTETEIRDSQAGQNAQETNRSVGLETSEDRQGVIKRTYGRKPKATK